MSFWLENERCGKRRPPVPREAARRHGGVQEARLSSMLVESDCVASLDAPLNGRELLFVEV